MTRDEAVNAAKAVARVSGNPVDVWEHTGDRKVPAQGRFVTRPTDAPPPHFTRWTKVQTVHPED